MSRVYSLETRDRLGPIFYHPRCSRRAFCECESISLPTGGRLSFSRNLVGLRSWQVVLPADVSSLHHRRSFMILLVRKIILGEGLVTMSAINQVGIPDSENEGAKRKTRPRGLVQRPMDGF